MSEADEAAALQPMAIISSDEAQALAEAANPGSTALEVEVDAGNGAILHTEQDDADEEAADQDNVSEEHESQADDDLETAEVEDALGQ